MSINPVQRNSSMRSFESTPNLVMQPQSLAPVHDVLITSSPSCCQWLSDIGNRISNFVKKIVNWIGALLGMSSPETYPLTLSSDQTAHQISNSNKLYVYNQLTQGRGIGNDPIIAQKCILSNLSHINTLSLFGSPQPQITSKTGPFLYDSSTADTMHWTANFADSHLFGFCEGPLLAQDELQVIEHPALAHIKHAFPADLRHLGQNEIALFQNVPRLGALDTSTPLPHGQTLYGNYFARASTGEIQSRLTRFVTPTFSDIFAMVAPRIPSSWNGLPYQKRELSCLFFTSYNAFNSVKGASRGKRVVIHTGLWGCGAFGNGPKAVILLQLAAARLAGVDEIRIHPMNHSGVFTEAKQLFEQIERQFPHMTPDEFLDHLTTNATTYNLNYSQGNGT